MSELGPHAEFDHAIAGMILQDSLTYSLARDLVTGEIEMDWPYVLPTDKAEYGDYCERLREEYGVEQSFLEQIIEEAKQRYKLELHQGIPYFERGREV